VSRPPHRVALAILAAGRGERFAGHVGKPLVPFAGRLLIDRALDAALASGLDPVLVVVGYDGAAVRDHVTQRRDAQRITVIDAPEWERGIAHSLHAVLDRLEGMDDVGAVCIGLADQPLVGAESYQKLAAAYDDGDEFAVATYRGQRGNPVLLGRSQWADARQLRGDVGAKALMRHTLVVEVPCDGTGDPSDVDTSDDLTDLEQRCGSKTGSE
jgi:molybdenum cofactor cytidylyltransferase